MMSGIARRPGAPTPDAVATSRDVFAAGREAFQLAVHRAGGVHERAVCIAGRRIRLVFAGPRLGPVFVPALAHLACEPAEGQDLTICCWDDASTGVRTPEPATPPGDGDVTALLEGDTVLVAWQPARRMLTAIDRSAGVALVRVADAGAVIPADSAAPFRMLFHWWAAASGLQFVHGAAVGTPAGGILLVGRGGSGKSTTALSCVGTRLGYAADDYCLLELRDAPTVHSVYNTGKADARSVARLPRLTSAFASARLHDGPKSAIFVHEAHPGAMLRAAPLRAVVVPRIDGRGPSRLTPLSAAAALRAVAPSTIFQLPGDEVGALSRMAAVVRQLPCLELSIGADADADAVPALLANLLGGDAP
jgi:hypothetical protein